MRDKYISLSLKSFTNSTCIHFLYLSRTRIDSFCKKMLTCLETVLQVPRSQMPELSSETVSCRHERRQERERQDKRRRKKEKERGARYHIDVQRQRTRLLDINGSLRVSRPSLIVIAPLLTESRSARAHCHESIASGPAVSLFVIAARYQRSSSLA